MITVTGGKYTTFRIMAEEALRHALPALPHPALLERRKAYFAPLPTGAPPQGVATITWQYLLGRYGSETAHLLDCAAEGENQPIGDLPNLWSELRWAARSGAVEHLDDLLLRRVRLGSLLPDGASAVIDRVRGIVQPELGWDDDRWQKELKRYHNIYQKAYSASPAGIK